MFQTCENIARLTYATSQLPLLCEVFLIPATLLVFRFNHLCRELDHTTGMLYIESKICSYCVLLHLIASCLDVQIRGASKAPEGPNGFVFARHWHGTSWSHPETKPLGGKKALENLGQQPANERWMGHFWHRKPLEMMMAYQYGQQKWKTTTYF